MCHLPEDTRGWWREEGCWGILPIPTYSTLQPPQCRPVGGKSLEGGSTGCWEGFREHLRGFDFPPCPNPALLRRGSSAVLWLVHVASQAQLLGPLVFG